MQCTHIWSNIFGYWLCMFIGNISVTKYSRTKLVNLANAIFDKVSQNVLSKRVHSKSQYWFMSSCCTPMLALHETSDRNSQHCKYLFSERELTFTFAICYRPSICLSVCRLSSVTFLRPTQAVQIFGNIFTALGTLAIHWHSLKISRRSSHGNPSAGGVKHKSGSQV